MTRRAPLERFGRRVDEMLQDVGALRLQRPADAHTHVSRPTLEEQIARVRSRIRAVLRRAGQ